MSPAERAALLEARDAEAERIVVAAALRPIDRRIAALQADDSGDGAARARRAGTVRLLEDMAHDVAALLGPITPPQGTLALAPPEGLR